MKIPPFRRGKTPQYNYKKISHKMCVTICGRFCPDEGAVA
ncbi:MAG: DUF6783 domain-containing protein, partial [Ruminococcus sp.]